MTHNKAKWPHLLEAMYLPLRNLLVQETSVYPPNVLPLVFCTW